MGTYTEIESFFDWIDPYVDEPLGKCVGYIWNENIGGENEKIFYNIRLFVSLYNRRIIYKLSLCFLW